MTKTIAIINPGTEARTGSTLENAETAARMFIEDLGLPGLKLEVHRHPQGDDPERGFYAFNLASAAEPEMRRFMLDFPGDDPETTRLGKPFASRRIYVDGSSWLWGYGLGIVAESIQECAVDRWRAEP